MRKLLNLVSLSIAIILIVVSFTAAAAITPALWKIEYQAKSGYLLGSIHIGQPSWYPLTTAIENAYQTADTLVVEIDMMRHNSEIQNAMMLPKDETIDQHLSENAYSALVSYLNEQHIPEQAVASLKPWAVASVIATIPYLKLGLAANFGIDSQFLARAKKDNKQVIELETAQFQISLLKTLYNNEHTLLETIAMPDAEAVSLLSYWKAGDLLAIEKLVAKQTDQREYQQMLVKRNLAWVNKLQTGFNDNNSLFIVVGAAHLVGDDGIPALLTRRGFKVARVQ